MAMTNTFHPSITDAFKNDGNNGNNMYHIVHLRNVRGWAHSHNGVLYRSDVLITNYDIDA